jgi:CheY-like chemotaxis protein
VRYSRDLTGGILFLKNLWRVLNFCYSHNPEDGLIAFYLSGLLEKAGYRIIGLASTVEMVLRKLEELKKPDFILMDVRLAVTLDGIETARLVRQRFSVPLIFLTGYPSGSMLGRMREAEPEGYIVKPFQEKNLLAVVRKAIDGRTSCYRSY